MTRLSSIALLSLFLGILAQASPVEEQVSLQMDGGAVHTMEGWGYDDCGLETDPIQIQSIEVSPDPPKPGQDLTVTVKATAIETVEEGAYADVTVKLGLIKLLSKTFDICEEARNANATVQCPIEKGDYTVVQTVALPKEIPPSKFKVNVRGYTKDDDDMACVDLNVDFTKRPFFSKIGW